MRKQWIPRGLVEMSWNRYNLYNLYAYSKGRGEGEMRKTSFQLKWRAKQLTFPYHASQLTQHQFLRRRTSQLPLISRADPTSSLDLPYPPATMLSYAFMERHVDVAIFRACFVPSLWDARQLVAKRLVTVNGVRIRAHNYVLEDGDLVQILEPHRLALFRAPKPAQETAATTDSPEADTVTKPEPDQKAVTRKNGKKRESRFPTEDRPLQPVPFMAPWMFVPEYLEVNYANLSFCFLRSPTIKPGACELPTPFDDTVHQRAFDFYTNYRKL
eukprot:Partr_v1_DN28648_c1_g1_i4_m49905 putative mitochondrial 37S ribosomal protein NAM9